jgi:endo-1,4-beta-xylanase
MKFTMKYLPTLVLFFSFSFAFGIPPRGATIAKSDTAGGPSLKQVLPFPIGAALKVNLLKKNSAYRNVVIREFNSITAENAMKFHALQPARDVFKWSDADYLVKFAEQNNMRVHAQTLIWPKSTPKWVTEFQGDKAAWKNLLRTHIQTVVAHFRGKVAAWDVVNEAFEDNGSYKKAIWLEKIGPEYIPLAFQYAHEADPDALLFYNDYGQEHGGKKLQAILSMVRDFKKRGVPIHGLGMQMHVVLRINIKNLERNLALVAATGLKVHMSELDLSVRYRKPDEFKLDPTLAVAQGEVYKGIVNAFLNVPKSQQYGITLWGIGDRDSFWNSKSKSRTHDYPLLFDHSYKPKPAYYKILDAGSKR